LSLVIFELRLGESMWSFRFLWWTCSNRSWYYCSLCEEFDWVLYAGIYFINL